MPPGNGLNRCLQVRQGELRRHQLEDHRPVFDLAAQPAHRSGQNPAVIELHGDAE